MLESKYQAGFGVIILGQNPLTFMIPIYSTTILYDSTVANAAEKVVKEELSAFKELLTSVVLGQNNDTAATSCFRVYYSFQLCYGRIFMPKQRIQ